MWYYERVIKDPFYRQLTLNIALIAVTTVLAIVGLSFVLRNASAQTAAIAKAHAAAALRNSDLTTIVALQQAAASAANYQTAINQLLPSEDNLISFPQEIKTAGAAYNVIAQASFSGDPTPGANGTAGFASFSLTASGGASDVLSFLKNIETQSSQFLIAVDAVNFSTDGADGTISASGRVFFQ